MNSAFVQLGMDVGLDKVKESAVDAGLLEGSLTGTGYPSFSIGISDPSAIRMAGAYATFAASGKQREPFSVLKVTGKDGTVYTHEDETQEAFEPDVADNVTDVLKTVVKDGTGTNAQLSDRQVAGKTGTTDGNKSAWFVGYTPQLSTSISMFRYDDNEKSKNRTFLKMYGTGGQEKIHGASFPSEIWHDYMEQALKGTPPLPFPTPTPIGKVLNVPPSPTPTPTVSETPSASPTPSPTPSESEASRRPRRASPASSSGSAPEASAARDTGGTDGGVTSSPTPTESEGNTRGNGNGGLFGGPSG
ncbi:Peptidoglycan D,D-transpeptidase FtsI [Streptomyces alboniger]